MKTYSTLIGNITAAELRQVLDTATERLSNSDPLLRRAVSFALDFDDANDAQGRQLADAVMAKYEELAALQVNVKAAEFSD